MRPVFLTLVLLIVCALASCGSSNTQEQGKPLGLLAGLPALPTYDDSATRLPSQFSRTFRVILGPDTYSSGVSDQSHAAIEQVVGGTVQSLATDQDSNAVAWSIYRIDPAFSSADDIQLWLSNVPGTGGWYGISDYAQNRWQLGQLDGAPNLDLDFFVQPEQRTASGAVYLLVLAYSGQHLYVDHIQRVGAEPGDTLGTLTPQLLVGPGKDYLTIEDAYNAAPASGGAEILVFPQAGNAPYSQPHLQVYKPDIHFWGADPLSRIKLDGTGYNYTGAGSVPRAVFQFNPGSDGGEVHNFEICNAHNDTYNGAAVRINQANHVQVVDCDIHDCDMGMMSNGSVSANSGADQWIAFDVIHGCGSLLDPGYNHNLYLGGTSATLHCCEVYGSLTGHNVKSRAHFNRIEYCYIHDSANREFDLVDDVENTTAPGSDSVLLGNVIVKDPAVAGNRNVIHFGADGGNDHNGKIYLVNNTIVTPFISPVVALDAPYAGALFSNNIIYDTGSYQNGQVVAAASNGASLANVSGGHNWLSASFGTPAYLDAPTTWGGADNEHLNFTDAANGDYTFASAYLNIADAGIDWDTLIATLPSTPGHTPSVHESVPMAFGRIDTLNLAESPRSHFGPTDLGAYEFVP